MKRRKDPGPQPRSFSRFLGRVLPGAKPARHPGFVQPQLATLKPKVPPGPRYIHEIKFDGYRLQAHKRNGIPVLITRGGHDWTKRFASIADEMAMLPARELILDGEIISARESGFADFGALQDDLKKGRVEQMVYYTFDLLFFDGFDLRDSPLIERKKVLGQFLEEAKPSRILLSEHFEDGATLLKKAAALGLEGIVSKRADAPYRSRRDENWVKVKCLQRGTFVIVGFVPSSGGEISKLRVARREGQALYYAGRAGGGLSVKVAQDLRRRLEKIKRKTSPLTKKIRKPDTVWVEPVLLANIEYTEMTADGRLRHPGFKGLVNP
jgi:bifunctional non-homologous end joining protein LigD